MSLADLITTYGYGAVGIGAFIEGETVVVLGGLAAHRGYLELPWVIFSAALGALVGDQFYFYLGRAKGKTALEKRSNWKRKSEKVFALLDRHQTWFILVFRFLYGFRTVTPFIIGASHISPTRFLFLDLLGSAIWATIVGTSGYLFGSALEAIFGNIKKYELFAFAVLAAAGILVWIYHFIKRLLANRDKRSSPNTGDSDS
jgi:membrane protein DedA with SNARE-associated domain